MMLVHAALAVAVLCQVPHTPSQASMDTSKCRTLGLEVFNMAGEYDGRFEAIVAQIIEDEGGYVDHPDDKGGPTKYGITIPFYEEAFGEKATRETIKKLTKNDARRAYHKMVWQKWKLHMLPSEVQPIMFDWMVMSGPRTPVKFLQRRVGAHPDGHIGPVTRKAVRAKINEETYRVFQTRLVNDIVRFLIRIARANPKQTVFLEGWFNRFCDYYLEGDTNDADHARADHHSSNVQPASGRSERSVRDARSNGGQGDRASTVVVAACKGTPPRGSR